MYLAVSTDVRSGVATVPGGPFGLLLPRSGDFALLYDVIRTRYASPVDRISLMAVLMELWCRMDPSSYMHAVSADPLPGTSAKTILINYGIGDAQVTWLGAHTIARSLGASMFASNVRVGNETLSGFPFLPDDAVVTGTGNNVIMGIAFDGTLPVPFINIPAAASTDVHGKVHKTPQSVSQRAQFFWQGQIVNPCGGPCISNFTLST